MHSKLPLLLFALAAVFLVLAPGCDDDDNNMTGPVPTATPTSPPASTATPTSPAATATRTVTPVTTATPTLTPNPALAFAGTWTGSWTNQTFGSTGSASLVSTVNTSAQTFEATLTLGGNVFGAGTPPPQTFSGSYASGMFSQVSPLFGNVTITVPSQGSFIGSATNVPNPNIARIDFTGTVNSQTIQVNYTITFSAAAGGGTAVGTMTLNKV